MNLYLFVSSYNSCWFDFLRLWTLECCLNLIVRKLTQQVITKSKCAYCCAGTWRVHISHCASIPNMLFQQKVRLPIRGTNSHPMRIIGKIHSPILHPFKVFRIVMLMIKHPVLPRNSRWSTQWSWRLRCLELTSIMCISNKELEMGISVHVNNDRCIVDNIVVEILQLLLVIAQLLYPILQLPLLHEVQLLTLLVHVNHRLDLQRRASLKWFVLRLVIKQLSLLTRLNVLLVFAIG